MKKSNLHICHYCCLLLLSVAVDYWGRTTHQRVHFHSYSVQEGWAQSLHTHFSLSSGGLSHKASIIFSISTREPQSVLEGWTHCLQQPTQFQSFIVHIQSLSLFNLFYLRFWVDKMSFPGDLSQVEFDLVKKSITFLKIPTKPPYPFWPQNRPKNVVFQHLCHQTY